MYPSERGGHRPENSGIKMFIIMVTLFPSPPFHYSFFGNSHTLQTKLFSCNLWLVPVLKILREACYSRGNNLSVLLVWGKFMCFELKSSNKWWVHWVVWFDRSHGITDKKRSLVFSLFLVLKTPFLSKYGVRIQTFEKSKKSTFRYFRNTSVQIWSHSSENCGR